MKSETEVQSLNLNLARFLLAYRNTPHSTTGEPPSQLFLGRRLRTLLDLLKPDLSVQINNRQIDQSVAKGGSVTRHFSIGQRVIARNYNGKSKRVPGIVRAQLGPLSYEVEIGPNFGVDTQTKSKIPMFLLQTTIRQLSSRCCSRPQSNAMVTK